MEWNGKWNGTEISIWNMEDARMEWNGRFQEWKGRQFSILHTDSIVDLQKNIYGYRVVINKIVAKVFHFNIIYAYYLSTNSGTLVVFVAQTVYALHGSKYIAICSIDGMVDEFERFDLFLFFYFEIDNLPSRTFFFHSHETFYLLFHTCFSLILFILLVFRLIEILFDVKVARCFHYGICSLAVWLCQILLLV